MATPCDCILLVEDNPQSVELTTLTLKKSNLANPIQLARDGAEAVDYVFGQGAFAGRDVAELPVLVLLDLKLPKVSGLEVLRRIRADERTRGIPVVILSVSREERDILESHQFGANGYMVKPIDIDKFNQMVRDVKLRWAILPPATDDNVPTG